MLVRASSGSGGGSSDEYDFRSMKCVVVGSALSTTNVQFTSIPKTTDITYVVAAFIKSAVTPVVNTVYDLSQYTLGQCIVFDLDSSGNVVQKLWNVTPTLSGSTLSFTSGVHTGSYNYALLVKNT